MNCKQAEKLIYLFEENELNKIEQAELKEHLHTCTPCGEILDSLGEYKNLISKLANVETRPVDKSVFTNSVINAIQNDETLQLQDRKTLRFTQTIFFRVASIFVILLTSFAFVIQNWNIQQSLADLEARYETKKNNAEFVNEFSNCVEISESQIALWVEDDTELLLILENSAKGMFPKDIKRFASKICQQPVDIKTMDMEEKKRLLFTLLKQNEEL